MKERGFTLTEVMIVVAIVGILSAIVIPSYNGYVQKAARTEAIAALLDGANKQEQYFVDNRKYASALSKISVNALTDNGSYKISLTSTNSAFTLTATPESNIAKKDKDCSLFTLTETGIKGVGSGPGETVATCWGK